MKVVTEAGKRKTAQARATVRKGEGRVRVNGIPLELWTPEVARLKILEPLHIAGEKAAKVDVEITVRGGGFMGQAEAARTALARGLVEFLEDEELRSIYLSYDRTLLVNDQRRKEPKHQLGRGARKKRQKSYR